MEDTIRNFPKQFEWEAKIQNEDLLSNQIARHLVCGMGGSALAADLLRTIFWDSQIPKLEIWRDYALPPGVDKNTLVITSSYSGNTEETISSFEEAIKNNLSVAAITTDGKLLELAKEHGMPYIQIPDTGIQPRMATGYSIKALLKIIGDEESLKSISELSQLFDARSAEAAGEDIARSLKGKIPIIYSSNRNLSVAYNWKIKFNETGKIPAFANRFPELNHNEMTGFDRGQGLLPNLDLGIFHFVFLEDEIDNPQIQKRMEITKKLYKDRALQFSSFKLHGENIYHKIFQSLLVADWAAYHTAKNYGSDSEYVPMVEEFKKMIK